MMSLSAFMYGLPVPKSKFYMGEAPCESMPFFVSENQSKLYSHEEIVFGVFLPHDVTIPLHTYVNIE
jgi:hypothetical protein